MVQNSGYAAKYSGLETKTAPHLTQSDKQNVTKQVDANEVQNQKRDFYSTNYVKPAGSSLERIALSEEQQQVKDIDYYKNIASKYPDLAFRLTNGVDKNDNLLPYENGNYNQIGDVLDPKKNCLVNVDKKVVQNMQRDSAYEKKVENMLDGYGEIFRGFLDYCEKDVKELSDDVHTYTVGAVTTRLVEKDGKPTIVTSVRYEYTEKETFEQQKKQEQTIQQRWDGSVAEIQRNFMAETQNKLDDAIAELFRDREKESL